MDIIVVIVDWFMKMICLKATTTNISLKGIAKIYRDNIWKLHGISRKILSDRGPQFTSKFMEEFTKTLRTKRQLSTAYHLQTDGQTERINQEIGTFSRHYVNYQQDDWTNWLAAAEFQYNDKRHAATVTEMEGTILTASTNNQTMNTTNITQIAEDLRYLIQSDMDNQALQV